MDQFASKPFRGNMKVALLFILISLVDCFPSPPRQKNETQRRNMRTSLQSTICDVQFAAKKFEEYEESTDDKYIPSLPIDPTLNKNYVLCRIDEEFGEGTSRNIVVVFFVIVALIVIGCIRKFCCTE